MVVIAVEVVSEVVEAGVGVVVGLEEVELD